MDKALEIKRLEVSFIPAGKKRVKILRGVNLAIGKQESLALVGESGSGKTITARSVMRILPRSMYLESGEVLIDGTDVRKLTENDLMDMRGRLAGMIFQEPSSYLNPVFTAGSQIEEAIKDSEFNLGSSPLRGEDMVGVKARISRTERKKLVLKMLSEVGLKENVYYQYPHQLSGGMQQRVMIAMALINSPELLIADEPTTALDVTTAYGIIELLKKMMTRYGLSILFITHDISLAANFAQKIAVMYAGKIVETGPARDVFSNPLHPYTERLISCLPERYKTGERIKVIEGHVPDFNALPKGCAFHPRCPYKKEICLYKEPGEITKGTTTVMCFKYG